MKKQSLALAFVAAALWASALNPGTATPIAVDGAAHHPALSPDGTTLLYSTVDHTGLYALSLTDGSVKTIDTDAAAGFAPVFTPDGTRVLYRTAAVADGLTVRDVREYSLSAAKRRTLSPMSRADEDMQARAGVNTYAMADFKTIKVTSNGHTKTLNPLADAHTYLWASVSPDGTRLLFTEPFQGVFVANLDGTDARRIARRGDYASWADNNTVVLVDSRDDGYVILASRLYAVDVNTCARTVLTDEDVKVAEATAAAGRAVFSTLDGKLFSVTLNK